MTPAAAADWQFRWLVTGGTVTPAGATVNFNYRIGMSSTVSFADLFEHGYVQDPSGYFRVFPEGVTDLTLRSTPTWAQAASTAAAWSTAVAGTTVWS